MMRWRWLLLVGSGDPPTEPGVLVQDVSDDASFQCCVLAIADR